MEIATLASSPLDQKRGPRVVADMGDEETGLDDVADYRTDRGGLHSATRTSNHASIGLLGSEALQPEG